MWRRLRRAGAVAPKPGLYVLPSNDACLEAVQWLAQEARTEGADPLVLHVDAFEGLTEAQLVSLFHAARREDYAALTARAEEVERQTTASPDLRASGLRGTLEALRTEYRQVLRIDHFASPEGKQLGARLESLAETLAGARVTPSVKRVKARDYRGRRWVTRPRPFVDRLACAWLIRRFINPDAAIRYAEVTYEGEVAFDTPDGEFTHLGNRCTFEVMVEAFGLRRRGLAPLAEIVHDIDLHDGRYARPEGSGLEAVLDGWLATGMSDVDLEAAGLILFDGMFASLQRTESTSNEPHS